MASPIDLSNCESSEQQQFMINEHIANLQRSEVTNPNDFTAMETSSPDDTTGIYTFGGQLEFDSIADPATGTVQYKAREIFVDPPAA